MYKDRDEINNYNTKEIKNISKSVLIPILFILLTFVMCSLLPAEARAQLNPPYPYDYSSYYSSDAVDYENLINAIENLDILFEQKDSLLATVDTSLNAFQIGNIDRAINLLDLILFQSMSIYYGAGEALSETQLNELEFEIHALVEEILEIIKMPQIEYPTAGSIKKGIITIIASILSQDVQYIRFEYSSNGIDWVGIGIDYNPANGWSKEWNTTTVEDDNYSLRVISIDNEGIERPSDVIDIIIQQKEKVPPEIICPENMEISATGVKTAVPYEIIVSDNEDPDPDVISNYPSGSLFPLGDTIVTVTAVDDAGNSATCDFTVTVKDTTAPHLICPADIDSSEELDEATISAFLSEASAVDNVDDIVEVSNNAPSFFPLGSATQITFTASDSAGNMNQCETMVVIAAPDTISDLYGNLLATIEDSALSTDIKRSLSTTINGSLDAFLEGNNNKAINFLDLFSFHIQSIVFAGKELSETQRQVMDLIISSIREELSHEGPTPALHITNPTDGDIVEGVVEMTMTTDSPNIHYVEFEYTKDGYAWFMIGSGSIGPNGWSLDWDTTAVENGAYFIRASTEDQNEHTLYDFVNIVIDNKEIVGDIDADGKITPADALAVFECFLTLGPCDNSYDINKDGVVTPADALCLYQKFFEMPSCLD
ncbi:MAG: HYR domain-containing protein [bacterium]